MEHVLNYLTDNILAIIAIIIAVASFVETKRQSRNSEKQSKQDIKLQIASKEAGIKSMDFELSPNNTFTSFDSRMELKRRMCVLEPEIKQLKKML